MNKLINIIDRSTTAISAALFAVVVVILSYNVFARFLGGGISWYMEASQYLNVWAMLIAGIGICSRNDHLRITALEGVIKGNTGKMILDIIVAILTISFYILLAYGTYLLASRAVQTISTMAPLKMAYVYWALPIISILSAASTFLHILQKLIKKKV